MNFLCLLTFVLCIISSNFILSTTNIRLLDCENSGMEYVEVSGMNCLMDRNFYEEDVKIVTYDRFNDRCLVSNERVLVSKDYVIILSTNESYYINSPQWSDIPSCFNNITKYQVSYLFENMFLLRKLESIKKAVGVGGEELFEKICNNINYKLVNFSSNSREEHRNIIRNFLRRFDVDGYVFNNKGYSKKCKIVQGIKKYEKKEVFGKCYKEMPIIVDGQIKFTSNMIDIQNIGTLVDCATKIPLFYENNQNDYIEDNIECSTTFDSTKFDFKEYSLVIFSVLATFQLFSIIIFIFATISYFKKYNQLNKLKKLNREVSLILFSKSNSLCKARNNTNSIQYL
ncbi:Hypothetical protein SRAE_2000443700 [Strongyloides ratti]|uniref:Uncharacterized protein n=1 Tax=Strongyloides ratti TaxID=34506 RepID=A0A090LQF6_STRRB|nr:Hypothetical protein SRAE_2000443700 [Strongyloides ratti]CEF69791.1 Hypothetical protein SRAE_2000443700 [Strongyloides ratti]